MFKGLSNLASMMKQAQEMQAKMGEVQASLQDLHVDAEAGGGMVKVTANGQQQIINCVIEPSLLETGDKDLLEDLVVSATNTALERAKELAAEKMSELTQGFDIPGLQDALSNFGK